MQANLTAGPSTIVVPAGAYKLSSGALEVAGQLTIRGAGAAATIIDGQQLDRVFHVLPTASASFSGITIDDGNAEDTPDGGGGIFNEGSLTLGDCTLTNNSARAGGAIYSLGPTLLVRNCVLGGNLSAFEGGAIFSYVEHVDRAATTHVEITASRFTGNRAGDEGGAVFLGAVQALLLTATVRDSNFTDNAATNDGGAIAGYDGLILSLNDCIFSANSANAGGAIANFAGEDDRSAVWVKGGRFIGNTAVAGGAVYNQAGRLHINDSRFSANAAGVGGGILNWGVATVIDSTLENNMAEEDGGGLASYISLEIRDSVVTGNVAGRDGGGIYNSLLATQVEGCRIVGNSAGRNGGGIANVLYYQVNPSENLQVRDTLVAGNTAASFGGGIYNEGVLTISASQIRNNLAVLGRNLYNIGTATLIDSDIGDVYP